MKVVPDVRACVAGMVAWELSTLPFPGTGMCRPYFMDLMVEKSVIT